MGIITQKTFSQYYLILDFDCVRCLTTHQPLCVILCRLPEKGRSEIEKIVEMKERDRGERKMNDSEEQKK